MGSPPTAHISKKPLSSTLSKNHIYILVPTKRTSISTNIFHDDQENDLPFEISEKTARILYGAVESIDFTVGCDIDDDMESVIIENDKMIFKFKDEHGYKIPVDESFNRIRLAKDGFLTEYYTGKGSIFLVFGFLLQLLANLPIL